MRVNFAIKTDVLFLKKRTENARDGSRIGETRVLRVFGMWRG